MKTKARVSKEISEFKRIKEELSKSEVLFSTIFEKSAFVSVLSSLPDGVLVAVNEAFERVFGFAREDALGKTTLALGINPDAEGRTRVLEELKKKNSVRNLELRLHTKSGEEKFFAVNVDVIEIGERKYILNTMQEITERMRAEEALRESESKYRTIIESASDGIFISDARGNFTEANMQGYIMLGYTREEILRLNIADVVMSEQAARVEPELFRLKAGAVVRSDWQVRRKDGTVFPGEASATVLSDGQVLGILRDITERILSEQMLRVSEERYRNIVENLNQAYYEADRWSVFTYCNPGIVLISGYSENELLGLASFRLVAEEDRARVMAAYKQWLEEKRTDMEIEFRVSTKTGRKFWVEQSTHFEFDVNGRFVKGTNILRDIDERKRAEKELRVAGLRLKKLSQRLMHAQEAERRAIAINLHDNVGQLLTAAKLTIQAALNTSDIRQMTTKFGDTYDLIEQVMNAVRNVSLDLHPSILDDLGLIPAMRWYLDRQTRGQSIAAHVTNESFVTRLPAEAEVACFRIFQEACTNILRHAHARNIWADLAMADDTVTMTIRDDGSGFPVLRAWEDVLRGKSLGLLSMQERANDIGATFDLISSDGGTTVTVCIPRSKET